MASNSGPAAQLAAENGAAHAAADDDEEEDDVSAEIPDVALEGVDQAAAPASPKTTTKRRKSTGEATNGKSPAPAVRPPVRETVVLPPGLSRVSSSHDQSKSPERKRKKRERKSTSKAAEAAEDEEPAPEKERRSKRKRKSDVEGA